MKRYLYTLGAMLLVGVPMACSDAVTTDPDPGPVPETNTLQIVASIKGALPETRAAKLELDGATGTGSFTTGNAIGLYGYHKDAPASYFLTNAEYAYTDEKVWKPTGAGVLPSWEDIGRTKPSVFSGCYPKQTVTNPTTHSFTVLTDQNAGNDPGSLTNYEKSDLLLASTEAQGSVVELEFSHACSRLVVYIQPSVDGGYAEDDLKGQTSGNANKAELRMVNLLNTCTVNLAGGSINAVTGSAPTDGITPKRYTEKGSPFPGADPGAKGATLTFAAVVPPQKLTMGKDLLKLTMLITPDAGITDGQQQIVYTLKVPSRISGPDGTLMNLKELKSGEQLTMGLTVGKSGLVLTESSITPWGTFATHEDTARIHPGVYTPQDLVDFSKAWNKTGGLTDADKARFLTKGTTADTIKLWRSLDMTGVIGFQSIGNANQFTGVFDGQNYEISNLTGATGIFSASASNSLIQKIRLKNCDTPLVNTMSGKIDQCSLVNQKPITCLLVGTLAGNAAVMTNCYAIGLGSLLTAIEPGSNVRNCYATGVLVATISGIIKNCCSTGRIFNSKSGTESPISNCYWYGGANGISPGFSLEYPFTECCAFTQDSRLSLIPGIAFGATPGTLPVIAGTDPKVTYKGVLNALNGKLQKGDCYWVLTELTYPTSNTATAKLLFPVLSDRVKE